MNHLHDTQLDRLYEELTLEKVIIDAYGPDIYYRGILRANWWGYPQRGNATVYLNRNGLKHRLYGPAYVSPYYRLEEWYKEDILHREGGPARTHGKNTWWFYEGELHGLDGPAVVRGGGPREYWIHSEQLPPKEYKKEIERRKGKGHYKI